MGYKVIVAGLLLGLTQASLYNETKLNHTCILDPLVLSCSANAVPSKIDSCCAETYGGLTLSTQFWSTYTGLESQGQLIPANEWTVHGFWPDFCNGSYTQYCDLSRQYDPAPSPNTTNGLPNGTVVPPYTGPSVITFLQDFGRYDLLQWMNLHWINQGAPNYYLWAHEFSKHATCFSTFDTPCYGPKFVQHEDVIQFYETVIMYHKRLPTWGWLAQAGITPSNSTNYTLSSFQTALTKGYGALPYIGCTGPKYNETAAGQNSTDNGRTVISEMWYYAYVLGRPQLGNKVPVNATGSVSSCATSKGALRYPVPDPNSVRYL